MQWLSAAGAGADLTSFFAQHDAVALAVSGGGDSVALMNIAVATADDHGAGLHVLTVDHGLRDESAAEAAQVAAWAGALSLPATILRWDGAAGNLQAAAREGRYSLMCEACAALGIAALATAHTRDDQAETVLMRLARGSGVDGLAGIPERSARGAVTVLRPFLRTGRDDLRSYLDHIGQDWIDDPTNEDARFERIRVRRAIEALDLDPQRLANTARMMGLAREALDLQAEAVLARAFLAGGEGQISAAHLGAVPREIALRAFAALLCKIGQQRYRPRLAALEQALDAALAGETRTLHGCLISHRQGTIIVQREISARRHGAGAVD